MVWINDQKKVCRLAVLVLLLVATLGPWTFDLIYVPSNYSCFSPFLRLKGDYCGLPLPGLKVFSFMVGTFTNISIDFLTGATVLTHRVGELLFSLSLPLFVLPVVSTFLLIVRGDRQRREVFNVVVWSLAAAVGFLAGMLLGLSDGLKYTRFLWGIWLYIGLAAIALPLEILILATGRRFPQER